MVLYAHETDYVMNLEGGQHVLRHQEMLSLLPTWLLNRFVERPLTPRPRAAPSDARPRDLVPGLGDPVPGL